MGHPLENLSVEDKRVILILSYECVHGTARNATYEVLVNQQSTNREKSALVFNRKSRRTQPYNFEPLVWSNFYSCSFQLCQREMFLYIFNGPCNFSFNYGPNPPLRYFTVHPTQNYPYLWCTGTLSQFSLLYFFIVILPHILSCCKEENSFWSVHPIFYTIQLVCVHSQAILRGPSCRWDRFKLSPG